MGGYLSLTAILLNLIYRALLMIIPLEFAYAIIFIDGNVMLLRI